jgi:hypothetical protein
VYTVSATSGFLINSLAQKVSQPDREAVSEPGAVATGYCAKNVIGNGVMLGFFLTNADPVATAPGSDIGANALLVQAVIKHSLCARRISRVMPLRYLD